MTDISGSSSAIHLYALPNEVFVLVLSLFPTHSLLPLATVSKRFHALVLRILHTRLLLAASLKDYKLILECYHPASKLTEPHVFCEYLGTDGLNPRNEGEGSLYEKIEPPHQLGRLTSLYSRFRPEVTVDDISTSETGELTTPEELTVKRPISLEDFEDFSQLCVVVNIVKVIPGTRLLLSAVNVEEGLVRVFRDWMKGQSKLFQSRDRISSNEDSEGNRGQQMLWADFNQNVGLKVRVRERTDLDQPSTILIHQNEESFGKFEIYIDELHIRTTRVLLTLERSLQEEQNQPKAVVFTRTSA